MERFSTPQARRDRPRDAHADVRPVHRPAVRAWLRHHDRQRPAALPALLDRGRGDHRDQHRGRAPRVLLDPRRGGGRDRHHPQPEAGADPPAQRGRQGALDRLRGPGQGDGRADERGPADRDRRPVRPHRHRQRGGPAQAAGPGQARPRLRLGRPQLRRVDGHRLDPGRLGAQPGAAGQLPGRGGPPRPDDRLRAPDPRGLDERHGAARRRRSRSPRCCSRTTSASSSRPRRACATTAASSAARSWPVSTRCSPRTSTSSTSRCARPTRSRTPTSTRSATSCAGPRRTCWRPRTSARSRSRRCRRSWTSWASLSAWKCRSGLALGASA